MAVGGDGSASASAVDEMIAQAMSPPSESQSGPLRALKYLGTACGLSSEVFDPKNKCVTVKQYLREMDAALKVIVAVKCLEYHISLTSCQLLSSRMILVVKGECVFLSFSHRGVSQPRFAHLRSTLKTRSRENS